MIKQYPYGSIVFSDGTEKYVYSEEELWAEQDKEVSSRNYY